MKQLTSYNRVAGYLNKLFDLLNEHYFESALVRPTITIQSTPRAYGHFSTRDDTWVSVTGNSNEINIGAGTLARPIENLASVEAPRMNRGISLELLFNIATVLEIEPYLLLKFRLEK